MSSSSSSRAGEAQSRGHRMAGIVTSPLVITDYFSIYPPERDLASPLSPANLSLSSRSPLMGMGSPLVGVGSPSCVSVTSEVSTLSSTLMADIDAGAHSLSGSRDRRSKSLPNIRLHLPSGPNSLFTRSLPKRPVAPAEGDVGLDDEKESPQIEEGKKFNGRSSSAAVHGGSGVHAPLVRTAQGQPASTLQPPSQRVRSSSDSALSPYRSFSSSHTPWAPMNGTPSSGDTEWRRYTFNIGPSAPSGHGTPELHTRIHHMRFQSEDWRGNEGRKKVVGGRHTFTPFNDLKRLYKYAKSLEKHSKRLQKQLILVVEKNARSRKEIDVLTDQANRFMEVEKLQILPRLQHIHSQFSETEANLYRSIISVVKTHHQKTVQLFMQLERLKVINLDPESFFVDFKDLVASNARVSMLRLSMREKEQRIASLRRDLETVAKTMMKKKKSMDRSKRFRELVGDVGAFYDHDLTGKYYPARAFELEFEQLLLDQREKEGLAVRRWIELLEKKDADQVPSFLVLKFVQQFLFGFCREFKIPREHLPFASLLFQRCIYPRIWKVIVAPHEQEFALLDEKFAKNAALIRSLSQIEIGIEKEYCAIPSTLSKHRRTMSAPPLPYAEATEALEDLIHLVVPHDMLQCLLKVSQLIYSMARNYATLGGGPGAGGHIGADSFFPIFLYVLVRARLPHLHRQLRIMTEFSSDSEKFSESGYYLTTFEGAVLYLMDVDEAEVQRLRDVSAAEQKLVKEKEREEREARKSERGKKQIAPPRTTTSAGESKLPSTQTKRSGENDPETPLVATPTMTTTATAAKEDAVVNLETSSSSSCAGVDDQVTISEATCVLESTGSPSQAL